MNLAFKLPVEKTKKVSLNNVEEGNRKEQKLVKKIKILGKD